MAIKTISSTILECKVKMTILAISDNMLANQLKICIVMVELNCRGIYLPVFGSMALCTIDLKRFPMRGSLSMNNYSQY
jgi:hypothetical protein